MPDRSYGRTLASAPGPSGPQMLRSLPMVWGEPLEFLRTLRQQYGPVVQFPVPDHATFLIDSPHLIRSVLMAYDKEFDKDTVQYRALSMVTGDGLLAARNELWRQQRPVVQPAFHRSAAQRLVADTILAVGRLVDHWAQAPSGSVVDVEAAMMRVGVEVVGRHLFDADLRAAAPRLAQATLDALDAVVASVKPPWSLLRGIPTPAQLRYRRAMAALEGAVADLVAERRARRSGAQRDDLLGLLLAAYPADPAAVRDQIITFLVAGHETVASALTWTLGLLAQHPAEQDRARSELDRELSGRSVADADFERLPSVRAAFDEALRLYPPAWVITRSASGPMVLGGRAIPAGSLIIMSPWLLHRDPELWPLPDEFLPQRFGDRPAGAARAATVRAEYLPFGVGPRLCIGRDVAIAEAVVVLGELLRRYEFSPAAPRLPGVEPLVTLRPAGGMRLRIDPIKQS